VFADGIKIEDENEEVATRRAAYCLSLGISTEFINQYQTPFYQNKLQASIKRAEIHKQRMDDFKREHGPAQRLPLDNCCGEETEMCRILR